MRHWFPVLLLFSVPALSQEESSPPPPAAAEPAAPPATPPAGEERPAPRPRSRAKAEPVTPPVEAPPAPAARDRKDPAPQASRIPDGIRQEAQTVLNALLAGDVRTAAGYLTYPFQLEERRFDAPEPLVAAWVKELRARRTDLMTLYDIEVLPYAEMEKKYGKPPARLGALLPRGAEVYAAVANLSGHAAVLLFRETDEGWRPFAYTD